MKSKLPSKPAPRKPEGNWNQHFHMFFENNPLPMWVYDLGTLSFLDVNEAAVEHYGYSRNEFLKLRITDIRPSEDARSVEKHAKAKRPRLQHSGEWRHCKKDGSIIYVEITSHKLTYEGRKAALVSAKDITGNKLARKALAESEERYRNLVENSLAGIYQTTVQGKIVYVNDVLAKLMGFKSAKEMKLLGSIREIYKNPSDHKKIIAALKRDGAVNNFETQFVTRSGEVKRVWLSASLKENAISGIVRDITESKRLEDSARAIETSYRSLFNSVAEAIYIQDRKGRFLDVNDGAAKMYGYPREFLIGKTPAVISAPGRNNLKKVQRAIKLAFEGQPQEFEFWGLRRNGEAFPKNVRLYKGAYLGQDVVIALAQDITERKQAEEALKKLSRAVEQIADSVLITDQEGIIQYVNPAFERSTGYAKEEIIGQTPRLLKSGEHEPQFFETLWKIILAGEVFRAVFINRKKNGKLFYEEKTITPVRDEQGNITHFVSTGRDITERKRAEQALIASEAELRALFASMPDAIFVFDREGRYLKIAPTNTDILYEPVEELLGKRMHEVFPRQKADELVGHIRDALDKKQTIQFEYALLFGDRVTWFSGTASPLTEDSVVWVGRDITERKLAEDALQQRLTELSVIYDASQRLQQILTPEILVDELIRLLKKIIDYDHGAVLLVDEPSGKLIPFAVSDQGKWFTSIQEYKEYVAVRELGLGNGITGWVAQHGQSICQGDVRNDSRYVSTSEDARSELCVPLRVGDQVIGVVNVESARIYAYTESDQRLLETVAAQIAISIQNARLFEAERLRRQEAETLRQAANSLTSSLELEDVLNRLLDGLALVVSFNSATVFLKENANFRAIAARGFASPEQVKGQVLPGTNELANIIEGTRRPLILPDVKADDRFANWGSSENIRGWMAVPLTLRDQFIGFLTIDSHHPNAFTDANSEMALGFASHAAAAIQNARLYEDAVRRMAELEALYESGLALGKSLDPREISEKVVSVLSNRLNWHHATLRVRRGDSDEVELLAFSQTDKYGHVEKVDTSHLLAGRAIMQVGQGMAGWVIKHGRTINSGNLPDDPRYYETFPGMQSGLYVPIWAGGQTLGCISVESEQPAAFSEADERLLTTLASQAASALENARLYQEALLAAERRSVLHQVSQEVARISQDSEQLYAAIYQAAARLIPSDRFTIALVNQAENQIDGAYAIDRGERAPFISFPLNMGIAGRVIETNKTLLIEDDDDPSVTIERVQFSDHQPTRSILAVPLRSGEKVIGSMSVQSYQPGRYTEEDGVLLEMLGAQATVAIENARLFEQVRHRIKEQEALNRASQALTGTLDLELLLENILYSARDAIAGAEKGTILLWEKDSNNLRVHTKIGYTDTRILELPFRSEKGYSGRAFQEKRPILIEDALAEYEPPFDESVEEVYTVQSGIVAPLIVKDTAIGVIALDNATKKGAFTKEDLNLLMIFASSAASVIENARLFEETRRRAEEFEALYQTASDVSSQTDLQTLLDTIIKRAQTLLGASASGLYLFDPERGDLELVAITDPNLRSGTRLALGEGLSGRVAQTKQPLVVNDYRTWENRAPIYEGVPYTRVLGIPMLYQGELIGVLTVQDYVETGMPPSSHMFTEQDVSLLTLFANTAAGAVYSARLLDQTRRRLDELAALAQVSSSLRTASTRAEMMSRLLDQLMNVLHADGGNLVSSIPGRDDLLIEAACGVDARYAGMWVPPGEGLSRRVLDSGEPLTLADAQKDPSFFNPDRDGKVYSIVLVPLKSQDKTISVISMGRIEKDSVMPAPFSDDDIRLLNAIADMAANALQRSSLYEETTRYAEQLVIINDLGHSLSETLDLAHIYEKLSRTALDLLPDTAAVFVSLFDSNKRSIKAAYGMRTGAVVSAADLPTIPFDESGYENQSRVILSGEPLIVPDLSVSLKDKKAILIKSGNEEQVTRSALYVPMKAEGRVIGVLHVQCYDKNRYTSADAKLLELVANTAAAAIQNARLFTQLKRRVDQLSALHSVDTAISSTTDLRVSLQSVLENVIRQLKVDAADVLLLNPATLVLQYVAGLGFFTSEITRTSLPLGKGQAGKSALERRIVRIPDLTDKGVEFAHDNLVTKERFAAYVAVPLMAQGEVKGVLEIFQRSILELDDEWMSFLEMLAGQAALAIDNALLFEGLEKVNIELSMAYDATIEGWSQALELRDQETQGHSVRVLDHTLRLAAEMGISGKDLQDIRRGVLLHDIGKMGVPDSILHKPSKLTEEEWEIMHQHPKYAYDMLAPIAYLHKSLDIPYCHHEKWDGSGYPRGLSGETIPLPARIFAIVDVFDALTSDRPYRDAWSKEKTLNYIREQSGIHFDPRLVEIFLKFIGK